MGNLKMLTKYLKRVSIQPLSWEGNCSLLLLLNKGRMDASVFWFKMKNS